MKDLHANYEMIVDTPIPYAKANPFVIHDNAIKFLECLGVEKKILPRIDNGWQLRSIASISNNNCQK